MSPDVKNSIHVGDRILEINGTPIRNVPLDEVRVPAWQAGIRGGAFMPDSSPTSLSATLDSPVHTPALPRLIC